jgi:YVTN family beta-propeller protein
VTVPLNGLDAQGRVVEIDRPEGATVVAGAQATVGLRGSRFAPPNLSVARGARVTWRWEDAVRHNVLLASGPRNVASATRGRGATYGAPSTRRHLQAVLLPAPGDHAAGGGGAQGPVAAGARRAHVSARPAHGARRRRGSDAGRRMSRRLLLAVSLCLLAVPTGATPAAAAPPPLTPAIVGEEPMEGVFRFPQAVAVSPGGGTVYVADQYSGVVQVFDAAGTFLRRIGARAARGEPGRLGVVGGLALDRAGRLYVLDAEHERVQIFSAADGRHLASFGDASVFNLLGGNAATGAGISASGIAVGHASPAAAPVVYVADQGNDRVARFVLDPATLAPTGPPRLTSRPELDLEAPQGITLDPAGTRLYVADDGHHRVVVLDPETLALVAQVGTFGTGPGQLQFPYDVAVDDQDPPRLYVADNLNHRVDVFDAVTLASLGSFGRFGYGPGVGNMAIARAVGALTDVPGGGVIAADTANNRVQRFAPDGSVVTAWGIAGRGAGHVTRPRGVAFTADGGIAAADTFDQRVVLFAPDGTYAGLRGQVSPFTGFATQGPGPGQYSLPAGVAADASGRLWVADTGNDRVVELDAAGAVTRITKGLSAPLSVAADGAGGVLVADTGAGRVVRVDPAGAVTVVAGDLVRPAAVAVAPDGTSFAADATRVRNLRTGAAVPAPGGGPWDAPAGLAVDAAGTLYVSETRPGTPGGARIVRGTPGPEGYAWDTVATEGAGLHEVVEPAALAVRPDGGTLLVADTGNHRILRLDAPGQGPPPTATLRVDIPEPAAARWSADLPGIACVTDCRSASGPPAR